MIRFAAGDLPELDHDLASRIVDAIDAGHYAVLARGPARMTSYGVGEAPLGEWTHESFDPIQASGVFTWLPEAVASGHPPVIQKHGVVEISKMPRLLPDLRLGVAAGEWADHPRPSPNATIMERMEAAGRLHLSIVRTSLAARHATSDDKAIIESGMAAILACSAVHEDREEVLTARAANVWAPCHYGVVESDPDTSRDMRTPPEPSLTNLVPDCVMTWYPGGKAGGREVVAVEPLQTWIQPWERPDPIECMRTLSSLRKMHERWGTRSQKTVGDA